MSAEDTARLEKLCDDASACLFRIRSTFRRGDYGVAAGHAGQLTDASDAIEETLITEADKPI